MKNKVFCKENTIHLRRDCKIQKYSIIQSQCQNIQLSPTGYQKYHFSHW